MPPDQVMSSPGDTSTLGSQDTLRGQQSGWPTPRCPTPCHGLTRHLPRDTSPGGHLCPRNLGFKLLFFVNLHSLVVIYKSVLTLPHVLILREDLLSSRIFFRQPVNCKNLFTIYRRIYSEFIRPGRISLAFQSSTRKRVNNRRIEKGSSRQSLGKVYRC